MNCIDAIEGTVKCIIDKMYGMFFEGAQDDTEYARNIKAVIDGTDAFILVNQEVVMDPELLKQYLYDYGKGLWMQYVKSIAENSADKTGIKDTGFYDYYFDYIYNHGIYPP